MKPLFLISSLVLLILIWDVVPSVRTYQEADPIGSTGCRKKWVEENGRCWRYCAGSDGEWCYTGNGCMGNCYTGSLDEACAEKTSCKANYECAGAAKEGCVTACPARNSSSPAHGHTHKPGARDPHGSTGCSKKWVAENGRCWRYCSGSSGRWCFTSSNCFEDSETCASKTACSATSSCEGATPGCVSSCVPKPTSWFPRTKWVEPEWRPVGVWRDHI